MIKPVTPTLVVCAVAALIAGLALARPGDSPADSSAPVATVYPSDAAAPSGTVAPAAPTETTAPADPAASAEPSVTAAPAEQPEPAAIEIVDFAFAGDLSVAAGQAIIVSNADGAPHTMTASDGEFDTGTIDGDGSAQITAPTPPGTYDFFCAIHPSMNATLTVT